MINRHFDILRKKYVQILTNTLQWRPVTITLAVIVILLMVPFLMFSQHELAPKEDQGVVFGIVQAAPNATIDQTTRFTEKVNDVFESMPETEHTFQITDPVGRLFRHGDEAVERTETQHGANPRRRVRKTQQHSRESGSSRRRRRRCPAAGISRWSLSSLPPRSRRSFSNSPINSSRKRSRAANSCLRTRT